MQGGRDLYPGCSLREETWRLESSPLSLPELCAQARICVCPEEEAWFSNSDRGIVWAGAGSAATLELKSFFTQVSHWMLPTAASNLAKDEQTLVQRSSDPCSGSQGK